MPDHESPASGPWVVHTKLNPPPLRADTIDRASLLPTLCRAVTTLPLTLVSAPAGFGKTTLLASLPGACSGLRLAWLALDEDDDDLARFCAGLIAALRSLSPRCGASAESLLPSLVNPATEARRFVGVLINDVLAALAEPFALVLDDLHAVTEPAVFVALDYLLERLPPQMHLVIATRHDPPLALARLRARRQMAEIRLADLRFSPDEARRFLNETLGLGLSEEHLRILYERMEGWAAGLSLLASSLDRMPAADERRDFLGHLASTDRYVFDFLADEVLHRQEAGVRDFLLNTSVLTELTPALCTAVTGRGDARDALEAIYRRNLFVTAADGARQTYRYHDLFREFLYRRLKESAPEKAAELHRRAARAESVPARAVRHYLAAEDWSEAAGAIEAIGESMLAQGALETLQSWVGGLPEPIVEAHPRLLYLLGVAGWDRWQVERARVLLERALQGFDAVGDQAGAAEAMVHLAACLTTSADFAGAAAYLERALGYDAPPRTRVQLLVDRTWQSMALGDWRAANADLDAAIALAEATGDARAARILIAQFGSLFVVLPGGVERVDRIGRLARRHLGDEVSPLHADAAAEAAWAHLWRGNWRDAVAWAERTLQIGDRLGGVPVVASDVAVLLAILGAMRGDHSSADRYLELLLGGAEAAVRDELSPWLTLFLYGPARIHVLQGRLDEARRLLARMHELSHAREWAMSPLLRAMLGGLLAMTEGRLDEAEALLREAAGAQRRYPSSRVYGNASLLLARLHLERGRTDEALMLLGPVLGEHEQEATPGGVAWNGSDAVTPLLRLAVQRGVHAAFAARVLDVLRSEQGAGGAAARPDPAGSVTVPATGEVLTPREVEVLRLVAGGASNLEIAETLVVSVNTVKTHVARILAKLGVESRTQAAVRARELGIG